MLAVLVVAGVLYAAPPARARAQDGSLVAAHVAARDGAHAVGQESMLLVTLCNMEVRLSVDVVR